jgi:dienelactone hydrolase
MTSDAAIRNGRIWLCDDDRAVERDSVSVGQTVFAAGRGLRPLTLYEFSRGRPGHGREVLARYVTDRHGELPHSVLLPYVGLTEPGGERSISQLLHPHRTVDFHLRAAVRANEPEQAEVDEHRLRVRVTPRAAEPAVFPADTRGHLQTGLVRGDGDVSALLYAFPRGCVRLFLVPRQFHWRLGDPIEPVQTLTVDHDGAPARLITIARSENLQIGSYQIIARPYRAGWYLADEESIQAEDIITNRRLASIVVRVPIELDPGYANGLVLTREASGRPLSHRPYFNFVDNFPVGTDVYAALDPDRLPAGLVSQRAAIYVIRHKTAAEWSASSALTDISGPGMTSAPKIVPIVPGCVNWNTTLVWPNPTVPGKYDIAIDFGNNAANPVNFVSDGSLDPPLDMIDGYVRVGFYVTQDPSLSGPFAGSIGQHDYALSTIQVPSTDAGPTPTDALPLTATVRYPAQMSGVDAPFAPGAFPLIVIMHGNSGLESSYLGYNYLLDHLAGHRFVAVSIYAPPGVMIETRARAILAHLNVIQMLATQPGLFQGHVDFTNVGIIGHSRGGEAVVRAARINTAEVLGWNLKAAISIAPTDYHHYGDPGIPLLVIYGANDGDVSGSWPDRTCFNIFDEAGRPRSFVFVYGATHDRFNTEWASVEASVEFTFDIVASDLPNLISLTDHQNVARGYVTAFMQAHLQSREEQLEYFSAGLKPALASGLRIHTSHQVPGVQTVDNFQRLPHDTSINNLGGTVTQSNLTSLDDDALRTLDNHSPHVVTGGAIDWRTTSGLYTSQIPAADCDVSNFAALAFRVSQKYGSADNPVNQTQDFFVRLTDGVGHSRAIPCSVFTDIPYPYVRGRADLIKSAMKSVRIPLASFSIANLGAQDVDLTNVQSVSFEFAADATGQVDITDIEFTL